MTFTCNKTHSTLRKDIILLELWPLQSTFLEYGWRDEWMDRWMDTLLSLRSKSAFILHMETAENSDTGLSRTQNSKYNKRGR